MCAHNCNIWTVNAQISLCITFPASILYKSTAGMVADGPITARCRFIKNAYWVSLTGAFVFANKLQAHNEASDLGPRYSLNAINIHSYVWLHIINSIICLNI